MTGLLQILVLVIATSFLLVNSKPLFQGISVKRSFDISFVPLHRKPIAFIKEKWSPFGRFGTKRVIEKRELRKVKRQVESQVTVPTIAVPDPLVSPLRLVTAGPLASSIPAVVETPNQIKPVEENLETMSSRLVPVPIQPPLSSNFVVIPTTNSGQYGPPPPGLYTDISSSIPVNDYFNTVQRPAFPAPAPVVEPELPPITSNSLPKEIVNNEISPPGDNSLVRGSKLAFYFGNVFLQLMTQFLANARSTFTQFSDPTVV